MGEHDGKLIFTRFNPLVEFKERESLTSDIISGRSSFCSRAWIAIKNAEDILSMVNVKAVNENPDDDRINQEIKIILKENRELCKNSEYTGHNIFYGKTVEISNALLNSKDTAKPEDNEASFSVNDTNSVINGKAKSLLENLIDDKVLSDKVKHHLKRLIRSFFRKQIADFENDKVYLETSKLMLENEPIINQIIRDVDDSIRVLFKYKFEKIGFRFPRRILIPPKSDTDSKGYMHFPLPDKSSGPEKIFVKLLDQSDKVLLWYKNPGHGKQAFCIPYRVKRQVKGKAVETKQPSYPDFIVLFKDGSTGIYEIKDHDKEDNNTDKDKALAISETVNSLIKEGYHVNGGLLYIDQQTGNIQGIEKHPELQPS